MAPGKARRKPARNVGRGRKEMARDKAPRYAGSIPHSSLWDLALTEPLPLSSSLLESCISGSELNRGKGGILESIPSPGRRDSQPSWVFRPQRFHGSHAQRAHPLADARGVARLQKVLLEESPLLEQAARFTLATGLRENNVLELEWSQVDLGRRVAWFYADQMKGRAEHGIPLNDAALAVLRERRGIHKRWVFGNPDYPLTKASNRAWYNALRRSKLKGTGVVWHTLRHTWASWAVMSGVRLEEVMKLGGWKTYSMVLRYAHLAPEHMAEAAAKVRPVSRLRHKGSLAQR
jgi:integrase